MIVLGIYKVEKLMFPLLYCPVRVKCTFALNTANLIGFLTRLRSQKCHRKTKGPTYDLDWVYQNKFYHHLEETFTYFKARCYEFQEN